jgi:hypothetical protein
LRLNEVKRTGLKMTTFQKAGALAAWALALCYIIGFTIFIFYLDPPSFAEPMERITFLIANKILLLSAMSIIYIFAGLALVVLVLALHEKLKADAQSPMQIATAIGIIWAGVLVASGMIYTTGAENVIRLFATDPDRAATLWIAVGLVQNGLGGGTELLGGLWIIIVSWIALRSGNLSKPLNWLGFLIGVAGILSIVPAWNVLVDIFGLSQIVWFIWVGVVMLFSAERDEVIP